jgi:hypothetical protein
LAITNSVEMRSFLVEQMVATATGKLEVQQARAVANMAQQVYNTVKMEFQFAQMKNKGINQTGPVSFGSQSKTRTLRAA